MRNVRISRRRYGPRTTSATKNLAVTLEYVVLVLDGGKHDKDVSIDITLYFTYVSLRHPALSD